MTRRVSLALFVAGFVMLFSATVAAENDTVELNSTQMELNNQAIQALQEDPPATDRAQRLIEAALISGEQSNLLYLTLGRAHQLAGECVEAIETFELADQAPSVEGISRDQIRGRMLTYRTEIEAECPGVLIVACRDDDTELAVEGIDEVICDIPVEIEPGRYVVEAQLDDISTSLNIEMAGGRQTEIEVGLGGSTRRLLRAIDRAEGRVERGLEDAFRAQENEVQRIEDERLEAERRRQEEERRAAQEAAPQDEPSVDVGDEMAEEPTDQDPRRGHLALTPSFGGYAVQARDGAANGGLLYGAAAHLHLGYAVSDFFGVEARLQVDYGHPYPLNIKYTDGYEEQQAIGLRTWRAAGEVRTWLEFFSFGFFVDQRMQFLDFYDASHSTPSLIAGPTFSISGNGVDRGDGYFLLGGRMGLLFDGGVNVFSVLMEYGLGYAQVGLEYGVMNGENRSEGAFRRGEYMTFNIGFRVPELFGN